MINKILLIICILLFVVNFNLSSTKESTTFFNDISIRIKNDDNEISNIYLEDYIIGVVAAEMPASFSDEALKAQAIAARSYAIYKMNNSTNNYDLVTNVSNQSYIDKNKMKEKWGSDFEYYYNKIKDDVYKTRGLVLKYNDEVIESFYFAMSNGYTEDSKLVFGEEKDYLKSVSSEYENDNIKNFIFTKTISVNDYKRLLNIDDTNISNINKSPTGRVLNITVGNKSFSGTDFRKKLDLRSTDFKVEYKSDNVYITTKGYGHGVGMSQYGAQALAKKGYTYENILSYYYQGVEISKY